MDDNQLYGLFWKCAAGAIGVVALSVASCTAHQDYVQTQVLAKAANPAALQCAFGDRDTKVSAFCLEAAKH